MLRLTAAGELERVRSSLAEKDDKIRQLEERASPAAPTQAQAEGNKAGSPPHHSIKELEGEVSSLEGQLIGSEALTEEV